MPLNLFPRLPLLIYVSTAFPSRHGFRRLATRSAAARGTFPGSKSLADDLADLCDWVGHSKPSSSNGRITSDEVSEGDRRRSSRDGESLPPLKMGRESMESYSDSSRDVRRFNGEYDVFRGENLDPSIGRRRPGDIISRNEGITGRDFQKQSRFVVETKSEGVEDNGDDEGQRIVDLLSEEDSADIVEDDDGGEDDNYDDYSSALFQAGEKVSDSYLSETRFDQCSVSPLSLKGIKDAGYEKMTIVQEATLPVILKGKDVLARAKSGTGKTVAFLLPSIEVVVKSPPPVRDQKRPPILVVVICPTQELAIQTSIEANTLLKYHPTIDFQVIMGGTRFRPEQKRVMANQFQILVATPERLKLHIENTSGFVIRLKGVKVLVLDEADHLLHMGFRKDIEKIFATVPEKRQTLLFSATIPEEVRQICHIALRRDHEFVNTIQEGSEETRAEVRQMHMVAPLEQHFSLLYAILKEHIAADADYKVLVFCTTAMVTIMVADLLRELKLNIRETHSRRSQRYRIQVFDEFRKSKRLILVTSDVSARGVDYPDITLVVQVGLPADREQYIHRVGRAGRNGKEGQGILLLAPWEECFLSTLEELPITEAPLPVVDLETKKKVYRALAFVERNVKEAAYQSWLGYYNSNKTVGRDKFRLVELVNEFSRCMGLDYPPAISKLVARKMHLKNISGLRLK